MCMVELYHIFVSCLVTVETNQPYVCSSVQPSGIISYEWILKYTLIAFFYFPVITAVMFPMYSTRRHVNVFFNRICFMQILYEIKLGRGQDYTIYILCIAIQLIHRKQTNEHSCIGVTVVFFTFVPCVLLLSKFLVELNRNETAHGDAREGK